MPGPPQTLPSEFFKAQAPATLPGDFFAAAPKPEPSMLEKIGHAIAFNPITDFVQGAESGIVGTALGAYNLARKIPGVDKILPEPNATALAGAKPPDSFAGKAGHIGEQVAEYVVPIGAAARAVKGASLGVKLATQALTSGGVSALQSGGNPAATLTGAVLGAGGELVPAVLPKAAPFVKNALTEALGRTTGAGGAALKQALEHPTPELITAMRGGTSEGEVLGNFKDALQSVKDARAASYQKQLAQLPQNIQLDLTPIQNRLGQMLQRFGVKPTAAGALDFSRSTLDKTAQAEVESVVNDLKAWGSQPGDLTPAGVDTLKRRIGNMYSMNSDSRALIQSVRDSTSSVLKQQVPGYADMTAGYEASSRFLDALKDLSLDSKNPGTAIRKLTTTLRQNNDYRQVLTDALSQFTSVDLKGQLAGLNLSKPGPQGLAGAVETGVGLLAAMMHGRIHPSAVAAIAATSPRLMGELMVAMSKAAPAMRTGTQAAAPLLRGAAPAAANAMVAP